MLSLPDSPRDSWNLFKSLDLPSGDRGNIFIKDTTPSENPRYKTRDKVGCHIWLNLH